jgi:HAMP domain-containing protein
MSLRSRLLLNMTFLLLFVVLITILATNLIVRQSLVEQAQVDGKVIAQLFSRLVQGNLAGQNLDGKEGRAELQQLSDDLVAGGDVLAVHVLDSQLNTLAFRVISGIQMGYPSGDQLGEEDWQLLESALQQNHTTTVLGLATPTTSLSVFEVARSRLLTIGFLQGSLLKVATPLVDILGNHLGSVVLYLPTDRVQAKLAYTFQLALIAAAFILVYGVEFTIVTARRLTKPLESLTAAAQAVETGNFDPESLSDLAQRKRSELGKLAAVFTQMAREVRAREDNLKEQVRMLSIEIDEVKKQKQVAEITETEYFRDLQEKAESLRARGKQAKTE